ncbi:Peptidyl serine alpha-galactosyltransferase [Coccomyxa sp. Obi]|nr:Peptidyl serine alpha-galactosyltransferase [Coccomyxa sp. Obi]
MTQDKGCTNLTRFVCILAFICCSITSVSSVGGSDEQSPRQIAQVHTVITGGCSKYFDWQILGFAYSFRRAGQLGPLTRLLPCTKEELKSHTPIEIKGVTTYVAPSFAKDSEHNDSYPPYNKPGAITHWLRFAEPEEPYILIMDSDIIMRRPYVPDELKVRPGWASAPYYDFLRGAANELAQTHLQGVQARDDTNLGPKGRLADMAGAPYFITKEDLKMVAPMWSTFATKVRNDPKAWNLTGDIHTSEPGSKPWIAEMYGYIFGAAKANVWHNPVDYFHWIYPGYFTSEPPRVLHYGLLWEVKGHNYAFDKAWYKNFDPQQCGPWDMSAERPTAGLFPLPPSPSTFTEVTGPFLLKLLLAIEPVVVLNSALCEHHLEHCPLTEQILTECAKVAKLEQELDDAYDDLEPILRGNECKDQYPDCPGWEKDNQCVANPTMMLGATDLGPGCRKSCKRCFANAAIQTRERVNDEVLEEGGSQSRPPVVALLERHMRSQQSLAAKLWASSMGEGSQGKRREPRPLPRLKKDLEEVMEAKKEASIGNVRLKLRHKHAPGTGQSKHVKLRIQARSSGMMDVLKGPSEEQLTAEALMQANLQRVRWLGISLCALWVTIILMFLAFLQRQQQPSTPSSARAAQKAGKGLQ